MGFKQINFLKILFVILVAVVTHKLSSAFPSELEIRPRNRTDADQTAILNFFNLIITDVTKGLSPAFQHSSCEPQRLCVVSKEELDEIWEALQEETDTASIVTFTIVTSNQCTEFEKIKTGIFKLKASLKEILNHQVSSLKYDELKAVNKRKIREFQRQIDDAKDKVNQEGRKAISQFQNELQKQENRVDEYLQKLEETENIINDKYVRLIADYLDRELADNASIVFQNTIENKAQIKRIVKVVYDGNVKNFFKTFKFLRKVNETEPSIIGYTTLFDEMSAKKQMKDKYVSLLMNEVQKYENFFEYTSKERRDLVKEIMPYFVKAVYDGRMANLNNVLDLVPKFTTLSHKLFVLNELINQLKNNDQLCDYANGAHAIFQILYCIIQVRKKADDINDKVAKDVLKDVESNLPTFLRDLMYSNLCIQNYLNDEYMFPSSFDYQRRKVLTSYSKSWWNADSFNWELEFIDGGKKVLIKNQKYNKHLYFFDVQQQNEFRDVRISKSLKDDPQAQFTLLIKGDSLFQIYNSRYGVSLYSDSDINSKSDEGRSVYGTRRELGFSRKWFIKTCRVDLINF